MRSNRLLFAIPCLLVACSSPPAGPAPSRAAITYVEGQWWSVAPAAGQLPYCLVIQARGSEVVVPLPVTEDGQSAPCTVGMPIGNKRWPLSTNGAGYKVFVVFSDRPLKGDTVADQIRSRLDEGPHAVVTSMDLRAPGQVALEMLNLPSTAK